MLAGYSLFENCNFHFAEADECCGRAVSYKKIEILIDPADEHVIRLRPSIRDKDLGKKISVNFMRPMMMMFVIDQDVGSARPSLKAVFRTRDL